MKKCSMISVAVLLCIILSCCHAGGAFDGTVRSDADSFQMDYTVLNQQKNAFLTLTAGDSLLVSGLQEAGEVDITVGLDGEPPIYRGRGLTDFSFSLNISETGTYRISVTGHHACGRVAFTKKVA